jgi:hypothetical protein
MGTGVGETGAYFGLSTGAALSNVSSIAINNQVVGFPLQIVYKILPVNIINSGKTINHYY